VNSQGGEFRPGLWAAIANDNGGMVVVAIGVASGILTFLLGGWTWTLVLLGLLLLLGVVALVRTLLREHAARVAAEARIATNSPTEGIDSPVPDSTTSQGNIAEETQASSTEAPANADQQESSAARAQTETAIEPVETAVAAVMEAPEPKPEPDPISEAYEAAFGRRIEDVDRLLSGWISAAPDAERVDRQSLLAYLHVIGGRSADVNSLRDLADRHPKNPGVIQRLAMALEWIGEKRQAADEIAQRLPAASRKQSLRLHEARLRRELGEATAALGLAREVVADDKLPPSTRREALAEQGRDLEALGRTIEAFGSFELALLADPADTDTRFHLAYQYSQNNLKVMALAHYDVLASQNVTGMAINNLGAALHELGIPMMGTSQYIKAAKEGVAISHGNLADLLLDGGFLEEARHWISDGEKIDETNRRIVGVSSRIQRDRDAEQSRYRDLLADGSRLREAAKALAPSGPSELPEGRFLLTDGAELEFAVDGDVATAKSDSGWEFEARLAGQLLEVKDKKGMFGLDRAEGWLSNRNGRLVGFIRDWPEKGKLSPLQGLRAPD